MKKVRRISFSEIFDYATCPLKYKFKKDGLLPRAVQDVYADVTIDALQKFFSQVGMGKRIHTATKRATEYWVERWYAHEFGSDQKRDAYKYFSKGKLLVTMINELYHPKDDKVATSKYPLEIAVSPTIIVTDSLDLMLVRAIKRSNIRDKVYYRLIQFCREADIYNTRYLDYRSSMVRLALQRDLNTRIDSSLDYTPSVLADTLPPRDIPLSTLPPSVLPPSDIITIEQKTNKTSRLPPRDIPLSVPADTLPPRDIPLSTLPPSILPPSILYSRQPKCKERFTILSTDRNYIYEIRTIYGNDKVVHPRLHYLKVVYRITSNICNSIANGYFYATTSKEACRNCEFKNICQLSLVNS